MNSNTFNRLVPAKLALLLTLVVAVLAVLDRSGTATGELNAGHGPKPTIVLVHGAWADSSGWNDSIKKLQGKGYTALAVATPLRSLHGDTAYLSSVLDTITGPIVLVGHSYGGLVLTNAATGHAERQGPRLHRGVRARRGREAD